MCVLQKSNECVSFKSQICRRRGLEPVYIRRRFNWGLFSKLLLWSLYARFQLKSLFEVVSKVLNWSCWILIWRIRWNLHLKCGGRRRRRRRRMRRRLCFKTWRTKPEGRRKSYLEIWNELCKNIHCSDFRLKMPLRFANKNEKPECKENISRNMKNRMNKATLSAISCQ